MRPRVIPALLLDEQYLVKTRAFKKSVYVGDPINTVKLFNEKLADELVLLDITATATGRPIPFDFVREVVSEAFMPIAYGGGISSLSDVETLLTLGIEKVIVNRATVHSPSLVTEASAAFGAQALIGSMDVQRRRRGRSEVVAERGRKRVSEDPVAWARRLEDLGVGEILMTSVDREGSRAGYDLDLIEAVSRAVDVPLIAHGGAGGLADLRGAVDSGASAVAAGQFFTFRGAREAVLITYPSEAELSRTFEGFNA